VNVELIAETVDNSVDWWPMVTGLFGGLGLFLLGVQRLTMSLKAMTGEHLRKVLARLTTNRLTAAVTGVGITAIVQSSTITTVLTVGFVSAGLMGTVPALGVVIGANVGTTITAQVIAFDVQSWSLAMVAVGAVTMVATKSERVLRRAEATLGLGLVLFSMRVMSESVAPLRGSGAFIDFMSRLDSPYLGLVAGIGATVMLQSSSATTALTIVLTSQGLLSPMAAVAVVIGANVGTCVTAGIAAIGKPTAAVRVAVGHILFNLSGAIAWIFFISQLTWIAERLPGGSSDAGRTLANAHTVFNVTNALVALAFLGPAAKLIERLVPERNGRRLTRRQRREVPLDDALLSAPALALAAARRELSEMAALVVGVSARLPEVVLQGTHESIARLVSADDDVDAHHQHLVGYLTRVGREPMADVETREFVATLGAANDLDTIGDVIETNLVRIARRRANLGIVFDPRAEERIRGLHAEVHQALSLACRGLLERDDDAAQLAIDAKTKVHELVDHVVTSPMADGFDSAASIESYTLERDIAEQLRRIAHVARRIARATLEPR
jgi:phosphate:Na+ symporter